MFLIQLVLFAAAQTVIIFILYRVVIRKLPDQVNDLIFSRQIENDFTGIADSVAKVAQEKLLKLEAERIDAIAKYQELKGLRDLNTTEREERNARRRAADRLDREIRGLRKELVAIYGSDLVRMLEKVERNRLAAAINAFLDKRQSRMTLS